MKTGKGRLSPEIAKPVTAASPTAAPQPQFERESSLQLQSGSNVAKDILELESTDHSPASAQGTFTGSGVGEGAVPDRAVGGAEGTAFEASLGEATSLRDWQAYLPPGSESFRVALTLGGDGCISVSAVQVGEHHETPMGPVEEYSPLDTTDLGAVERIDLVMWLRRHHGVELESGRPFSPGAVVRDLLNTNDYPLSLRAIKRLVNANPHLFSDHAKAALALSDSTDSCLQAFNLIDSAAHQNGGELVGPWKALEMELGVSFDKTLHESGTARQFSQVLRAQMALGLSRIAPTGASLKPLTGTGPVGSDDLPYLKILLSRVADLDRCGHLSLGAVGGKDGSHALFRDVDWSRLATWQEAVTLTDTIFLERVGQAAEFLLDTGRRGVLDPLQAPQDSRQQLLLLDDQGVVAMALERAENTMKRNALLATRRSTRRQVPSRRGAARLLRAVFGDHYEHLLERPRLYTCVRDFLHFARAEGLGDATDAWDQFQARPAVHRTFYRAIRCSSEQLDEIYQVGLLCSRVRNRADDCDDASTFSDLHPSLRRHCDAVGLDDSPFISVGGNPVLAAQVAGSFGRPEFEGDGSRIYVFELSLDERDVIEGSGQESFALLEIPTSAISRVRTTSAENAEFMASALFSSGRSPSLLYDEFVEIGPNESS